MKDCSIIAYEIEHNVRLFIYLKFIVIVGFKKILLNNF